MNQGRPIDSTIEADPMLLGLRRSRRFVKVVSAIEATYTMLVLMVLYFANDRAIWGLSVFLGLIVNAVFMMVAGMYGACLHKNQTSFSLGTAFAVSVAAPLVSATIIAMSPRLLLWYFS